MKEYRDEWVDDITLAPVATPPQKRVRVAYYSCDVCGDDGYLYEYGNQQLCSTHLRKAAWDDSPSKGTGKCEGCGEIAELREYADGRVGCEECLGDWAFDDAEMVGDFLP